MDAYRLYEATQVLTDFVDALSNWWVRRNRSRFWAPGLEADKLDAHWTLYDCLDALARLLAPFLPFATEEMWQNLVVRPSGDARQESVHLCDYPEPDEAALAPELSRVMGAVRSLVSLGLQVRTAQKLRVRQPLQAAEVDADIRRQIDPNDIVITAVRRRGTAGFNRRDIARLTDDGFAVQEAGCEFFIVARCAHRDRYAACRAAIGRCVSDSNFQWLFNGHTVLQAGLPAVGDFADVDCVAASSHGAAVAISSAGQYIVAPL